MLMLMPIFVKNGESHLAQGAHHPPSCVPSHESKPSSTLAGTAKNDSASALPTSVEKTEA